MKKGDPVISTRFDTSEGRAGVPAVLRRIDDFQFTLGVQPH